MQGKHSHRRDEALDLLAPPVCWPSSSLRTRKLTPRKLHCLFHHPKPPSEDCSEAGFSPCDPILVFDEYLLSATDDGRVCVYRVQPSTATSGPVFVAPIYEGVPSMHEKAAIVAVAATDKTSSTIHHGSTKQNNEGKRNFLFLGHVAVLTADGDVHLLEFREGPIELVKVHSWNTGQGSATCLSFHQGINTHSVSSLLVCVGSEMGYLTDWEIFVPTTLLRTDKAGATERTPPGASKREGGREDVSTMGKKAQSFHNLGEEYGSRLVWRGELVGGSIIALSALGPALGDRQRTDVSHSKHTGSLAVHIGQSPFASTPDESRTRDSSGSSIKVIDTIAAEHDFAAASECSKSHAGPHVVLALEKYCICIDHGIVEIAGKGFLEYPCIGRSVPGTKISQGNEARGSQQFCQEVACCLRGGTVYSARVVALENETPADCNEVTAFVCARFSNPTSLADRARYVQGFTTGDTRILQSEDKTSASRNRGHKTNCFVCSWMVGTLHVYDTGLPHHDRERVLSGLKPTTKDSEQALCDMADNGTVKHLIDLLITLDELDPLLEQEVWNNAWIECTQKHVDVDAKEAMRAMSQNPPNEFLGLRSLLLWLSQENAM